MRIGGRGSLRRVVRFEECGVRSACVRVVWFFNAREDVGSVLGGCAHVRRVYWEDGVSKVAWCGSDILASNDFCRVP